ncbi:MAG: AAA family ATPase [Acidobacteriota bacterium]
MAFEKITIRGFKSIRALEAFEFKGLNLLIGANGAGKSNFVDFFRFLNVYLQGTNNLDKFVRQNGKADAFLFNGPKATKRIAVHLESSSHQNDRYLLNLLLTPTLTGELDDLLTEGPWRLRSGQENAGIAESPSTDVMDTPWESAFSSFVYHFHDTSTTAAMRRDQSLRDWRELKEDAGNIAAFLYRLRQTDKDRYADIRYHVQLIAPYFDDFILEPEQSGPAELIRLEWRQKGNSTPFQPFQFSDGTIRFICLAAALLQPNPPGAIVIDEPELGLHPFALGVLASMLRKASDRSQIIVSTQSAPLLDAFEPEEVIVVDRANGSSRFRRLEAEPLQSWLQEYSLGQLWQKNVIEGSPLHE